MAPADAAGAGAVEEGGGILASLVGEAGAEAAVAAVPVVGQVLAAGALVGTLIDGLVHLFHKAKTPIKNAPDPTTLAAPSTALVQSYSQGLPTASSGPQDRSAAMAAF